MKPIKIYLKNNNNGELCALSGSGDPAYSVRNGLGRSSVDILVLIEVLFPAASAESRVAGDALFVSFVKFILFVRFRR